MTFIDLTIKQRLLKLYVLLKFIIVEYFLWLYTAPV